MSDIPRRPLQPTGDGGRLPAARPVAAGRSHRTWLDTLVIVFAVVVAICGLVGLGFLVLLGVGLSRMGDNK